MVHPGSSMQSLTAKTAADLAGLMYSYRYGLKEKYFAYLERLQSVMDDALYRFYETLGEEASWKGK